MASFFSNRGRGEATRPKSALPELPTTLPYEMRDEMSWLDFSAPVNPLGTPKNILQALHNALIDGELAYRPDREGYALRRAIAKFYEIPSDSILCGTTATQLIGAVAHAQRISAVGIMSPCPYEYHLAISNSGHSITTLKNPYSFAACDADKARALYGDFDAVVLANPSFPASRLLSEDLLRGYLETCDWVIIDESFIELSLGGESFIRLTQFFKNLIIVRDPSATFAMPGMPLSYLVAHPQTIQAIKAVYDSSSASMAAEIFSTVFPAQMDYLERTHDFLEQEIPWLQCMLSLIPGISIFPAEGNYVLCSFNVGEKMNLGVSTTEELCSRLQLAGFLITPLTQTIGLGNDAFFCVSSHNREENTALINAMKKIICRRA